MKKRYQMLQLPIQNQQSSKLIWQGSENTFLSLTLAEDKNLCLSKIAKYYRKVSMTKAYFSKPA